VVDRTTTALHAPDAADQTLLEGRGSTTIADKVLEQVARRLALEVPGVVRHSSGGPGPLGTTLPTASVQRAGDRARLSLTVAVQWEAPVQRVAADLRDTVRRRLGDVTGATIDRVDVTVAALVPEGRRTDRPERRRVE